MGEQRDQRVLPHIGGLTAHIGACDQQHPPAVIKLCVVGDKRDIPHRFYHWVTTSLNLQQGLIGKTGPAEIKHGRPLCKTTEHIKITQRGGGRLQWGERFRHLGNQRLIKVLFPRQCAAFAGKRLVFEGFEFGRNEPLDIFQRLAALISIGRLF